MRKSRAALVSAAAGIAMVALAACSSGSPASSNSESAPGAATAEGSASSAAASSPAAGEPTTISLWHMQTDQPEVIDTALARFQTANPNVTLDVSATAGDAIKDKLKVALGANDAPCIFPTWGGGPLASYVDAGQVLDLTPYMDADGYKDRFVPAALSNVTLEDKIYGVPVENSDVAVIFYSKPIFEKYGLTPPTTWSEFTTVVDTLIENGVAPIALANKDKWTGAMWYDYLVERLGGSEGFKSAALRTGGAFTDPAFVRAGEIIQELVDQGAFAKGFNGLEWGTGGSRKLLYSGKAAMELMGGWNYGIFLGDGKADEFGFFPFPTVDGGTGDPSAILGNIGGNFYSISSTCADPDTAFEVIKYLIDDDSVAERIAAGRVPPVKGIELSDPNTAALFDLIQNASSVQLWWDQYMPSEFAQLHLNEVQSLFGGSATPEEVAQAQEELATTLLGPTKS